MRFVEVSPEELQNLRPALSLLERVNHASSSEMANYTIYGICTKPELLEDAEETVFYWDDEDEDHEETKTKLSVIAVAVPMSSDFLYYLTGSGLKIHGLTFAYFEGEGKGDRTDEFGAKQHDRISMDDFQHLAVADGDVWLGDFLQKHGSGGEHGLPEAPHEEVERDSEATLNAVPEPEDIHPPAAPPAAPKASSLHYEGLEDWFTH
jgi:hypothetical protein